MRKKFRAAAAFLWGFLLMMPATLADDPVHKLGRGVVNVLTCWIEIPKQFHVGAQEDNPVVGVTSGFGKGVGLAILRLGVGAYETVTFPISYPRGYVSPYEPMQLPDYAWE